MTTKTQVKPELREGTWTRGMVELGFMLGFASAKRGDVSGPNGADVVDWGVLNEIVYDLQIGNIPRGGRDFIQEALRPTTIPESTERKLAGNCLDELLATKVQEETFDRIIELIEQRRKEIGYKAATVHLAFERPANNSEGRLENSLWDWIHIPTEREEILEVLNALSLLEFSNIVQHGS